MMVANENIILGFDLYGTLLSTESIADELTPHLGEKVARKVAALWRRYQLEYTWRLNSMSLYRPWSEVTEASLRHALAEYEVPLGDSEVKHLMNAYNSLRTFPDVPPALKSIATDPNVDAYVFSNGTRAMITASIHDSPSLSLYAAAFKGLVTVDEVGVFKPAVKAYEHFAREVGKGTSREEMSTTWLVSGNPFDLVGARSAGMQSIWINRAGEKGPGWVDQLGALARGGPTVTVKGVDAVVDAIREWIASQDN